MSKNGDQNQMCFKKRTMKLWTQKMIRASSTHPQKETHVRYFFCGVVPALAHYRKSNGPASLSAVGWWCSKYSKLSTQHRWGHGWVRETITYFHLEWKSSLWQWIKYSHKLKIYKKSDHNLDLDLLIMCFVSQESWTSWRRNHVRTAYLTDNGGGLMYSLKE
jgi:hypothetical protein